eukprot:TRINITY_DN3228_c0_g1_i6.p1 TRINITY_DN3228_c0_g1~~TRINITY_DN3228_c0_g1_i6.p1  ORF type:complete len:140 (-),score=21.93 TRINITY_DN3228_c0_g1_i6:53-472(-)
MRFTAIILTICLAHTAQSLLCGRYTTKTVRVGASTKSVFQTQRQTRRCTVLYKLEDDCSNMKLTCKRYFVPNKDDFRCRRGDKFFVKSSGSKPRVFCNKKKPTEDFPVLSTGSLKVWYQAKPSKEYPNKGVTCKVVCDQ